MIQLILSKKIEKMLFSLKKKSKFYLNLNYLSHIFLFISLACVAIFYFSQDKNWVILSGLGGKCIDFENKDFINGAVAIGYECFEKKDTQSFRIKDYNIAYEDKCLDILGDGKDNDLLAFRACNNSKTQHWQYNNEQNTITSTSGKCIDLAGGADFWEGHQRIILWSCNGGDNQKWYLSKNVAKERVKSEHLITTNSLSKVAVSDNVVASSSGKLVFLNGYKDGFLLFQDKSSRIDISKDSYLVPAGIVENGVFNH